MHTCMHAYIHMYMRTYTVFLYNFILLQFLDAFQNTQMFDVFVQQRETPVMYSSIANG